MAENLEQDDNFQEVKFYLHAIKFLPYSDSTKSTNDILSDIMTFLNKEYLAGNAYAIDRNKGKPGIERREMFMMNPVKIAGDKRYKCALALIKDKPIMLKPIDTFELVPFSKTNGSLVELTRFYIDYSISPAIVCVEYNHNGSRVSDLEYYFRNLATGLHLAKGCQITTYLHNRIDKTLAELQNVLSFEIKLRPQNIAQIDNEVKHYITEFATLGNKLKPQYIRIAASFQTPGAKVKSQVLNKEVNTMMRDFLKKFQKNDFNIEPFDEFEFKFVNNHGEDDAFNLIKGKREIVIRIERGKHLKNSEYYELVKPQFNEFTETFRR